MGFFKEAGESLVKYGGIIANKTEEYTKIAKLTLDNKKLDNEIEKIKKQIGNFVLDKIEDGKVSIDLNKDEINEFYADIKRINSEIKENRKKIKELKEEENGETSSDKNDENKSEEKSSGTAEDIKANSSDE